MLPLFAYPGGKRKLLPQILPYIPRDGVRTYCEPFCGGLAVMLAQDPFPREVANDACPELVSCYKCARSAPEALATALGDLFTSRKTFYHIRDNADACGTTELAAATRFFWLTRCSFGAQRRTFALDRRITRGCKYDGNIGRFVDFSKRCANTVFTCGDALETIKRESAPDTFFFVDPPYVECGETSYKPFTREQMEAVRDALQKNHARWLLTCDDSTTTNDIFKNFRKKQTHISYTMAKTGNYKQRTELLVFSDNLTLPDGTELF